MYISRLSVTNIRSISQAVMDFPKGKEAGWHVILGSNGAGKSSMIRAFALLMMGEKEAWAARQDFSRWLREGETHGVIEGQAVKDEDYDSMIGNGQPPKKPVTLKLELRKVTSSDEAAPVLTFSGEYHKRSVWGGGRGWFCASFGPFRRFTGGDKGYERLFLSNKRLAPHLTALGEDVALTDAMNWLTELFSQGLQDEKNQIPSTDMKICNAVTGFLNDSLFLPNNAVISHITTSSVMIKDGNGTTIPLDQLSDGYRSAMSMVIELVRQMFKLYDNETMLQAISREPGKILAPGVVAIDEVDVHLHPTWQRDIGKWLTRCFPQVQFIVTTHSPIVCRAVASDDGSLRGSVWRLPAPGSSESFHRLTEDEMNQLIFGDVLDAYSTELFGQNVLRSSAGDNMLERLAQLNINALDTVLTQEEQAERQALRKLFPANAGIANG